MKKFLTNKKFLICLCATAFLSATCATFSLNEFKDFVFAQEKKNAVKIEEAEIEIVGVNSLYYQGEKLNMQECTLWYEGEMIIAKSELVYPSGNVVTGDEYLLDTMGEYQLIFRAKYQSKQIVKKVYFNVIKNNFAVSTTKDKVEFNYEYEGKIGTAVTLYNESALKYNTVVDISSMTKNDILFEAYSIPQELGVGDFTYFELKLTDHYDSSNYVVISFNYFDIYKMGYFAAGAYNQPKTGYEYQKNRLHVGSKYGAAIPVYLYGTNHDGSKKVEPIQIRFDYAEKAFYAGPSPSTGFVIDLDDSKYFSNLWEGFTNGEVELSFSAGDYLSERPAKFLVSKIAKHDLTVTEVADTAPPSIVIDADDYDVDSLPNGLVGEKYPVFPYTCNDDNFKVASRVSVYGNYYSNSRFNVQIKNGYFYPDTIGMYYIEYYARDYSGNEAMRVLPVKVVNESEWQEIEMLVDESFFNETYYAGYTVQIPKCKPLGGFGNIQVETKISLNDETFIIGEDALFLPKKSGDYIVTYTCTDIVGKTATVFYTLKVKISDNPVFLDKPIYNKYLIANSQYVFPPLNAYDYWDDVETVVETKLRVIDGNGERVLDSLKYTPLTTDISVKVQYVAETTRGIMTTEYVEIPVINVKTENNLYDLTKYFYGEELSVVATESNMCIATAGEFDFINALLADGFSLELGMSSSYFTADSLRVRLTDSLNAEECFIFDVKIVENQLMLSINNGVWLDAVNGKSNELLTVAWDNQTNTFTYGDFGKAIISETVNGKSFAGFTSEKLYLSFEMINTKTASEIRVMKINKQTFSTIQYDLQKPAISYSNDVETTGIYGSKYVIQKAYAADVLDPNISFRMQVTDPTGNYVKDINGVELVDVSPSIDYEIDLTMYGTYFVQYYAEDSSRKKENNIGYGIVVLDFIKPVIKLNGKIKTEGMVDKAIYIPNATAIDNQDVVITVKKFIVLPNGWRMEVQGELVSFKEAGIYTVNYYAYDSSGNFSVYTYTINIS